MARTKAKKTSASKISPKIEKRVVALSLQSPEFGARRLLPLLKAEKTVLSESAVYTILRRNGLGSRDKRFAAIEEHSRRKPAATPGKTYVRMSPDVEAQVVQISLQNPEFGARRLSYLLASMGIAIPVSTIYRILRRNRIQTRNKRLARIEAQQAREAPLLEDVEILAPETIAPPLEDEVETYPPDDIVAYPADEVEALPGNIHEELQPDSLQEPVSCEAPQPAAGDVAELIPPVAVSPPALAGELPEKETQLAVKPEPHLDVIEDNPKLLRVLSVSKAAERARVRRPWFLTFVNIFLLLLLLLMGFYTWRNLRYANTPSPEIIAMAPRPAGAAVAAQIDTPPLSAYRIITERNLFNISKGNIAPPKEEIAVEKIAMAEKDLGLILVGTAVADDPQKSRAFIDNRNTRIQEVYRQGDQAGTVKIKKILRNKVIITSEKGDALLTVEIKPSGKSLRPAGTAQWSPANLGSEAATLRRQRLSAKTSAINLNQEELAASLTDTDKLLKEVTISAYMKGGEPAGFRLGRIPAQSVLRKMGLRSRDIIIGVDDEDITGPDQASDFFQKLSDGGEISIKIMRRRRTRQLNLNIE
jgi:type II secretion system protein C